MQHRARWARLAIEGAREAWYLSRLPPRVAAFFVRAVAAAVLMRDYSSLGGVTRPRELAPLLRAARGGTLIVEVGTGTAWTAICLALANERARVATYDLVPHLWRAPYINMLDHATRERIEFLTHDGNDPIEVTPVDLVFIDASHECDDTIETFRVWEPLVARGGAIAFHDYADSNWPGVREAVSRIGLKGQVHGHLFVWTKP